MCHVIKSGFEGGNVIPHKYMCVVVIYHAQCKIPLVLTLKYQVQNFQRTYLARFYLRGKQTS